MTSTPTPEPGERRWVCHKPGWMGPCSPQSTHHNGFDWGCGWIYFPPAPGEGSERPAPPSTPVDGTDGRPESDADQLREAAAWLDTYDAMARVFFQMIQDSTMSEASRATALSLIPAASSDEVQTDLRRIADSIAAGPPVGEGRRLDEAAAWVRSLKNTATSGTQHDIGFRTACGEIAIHLDLLAAADRGEGPMTKRPDTTWLRDLAAVRANVTSDPKAGDMLLSYADFIDGAHDWANDGSCVFCDRCGIELPIEDDAGRITDTLASTCEGSFG